METTECNNILILGGYSPLFVDLRDSFNQRLNTGGSVYPNDMINRLPYPVIHDLAKAGNWPNFKDHLRSSLLSAGYTSAQYDAFIADYDWWWRDKH